VALGVFEQHPRKPKNGSEGLKTALYQLINNNRTGSPVCGSGAR
jgi:hypothetical protein